ncbi:hypothetical protein HX109_10965 [Galbibacter sp. BG1]|uniref:hypothetical protein n=1 Tax=Galbibacter sp. BG1 TaxID=1170699 RepID=UPI0015B8DF92|nr:hypothetical protein [Galbibacter sp. BG1]QLE02049.1 hypothetical protein HX109_10965 [Galbibacter sp. BG1]
MGKPIQFILILILAQLNFAQTNTFPPNGNVGIGESEPSAKLEILKDSDLSSSITIPNSSILLKSDQNPYSATLRFGVDKNNMKAIIQTQETTSASKFDLLLNPFGGNVGINTSTPEAVLDVDKSINNFWSARIRNTGGESLGLLIKNGYGGAQSHNYPTILRLEDGNGNLRMKVQSNGKIGMNTEDIPSGYTLAIKGKAITEEIKIQNINEWSDFVFKENYKLPTLEVVESYINEKGHLKDIPSAKEVKEDGIFLGEMNAKLLQKIEELTLYAIQQEKRIISMEEKNEKLIHLLEKVLEKKK